MKSYRKQHTYSMTDWVHSAQKIHLSHKRFFIAHNLYGYMITCKIFLLVIYLEESCGISFSVFIIFSSVGCLVKY